MCITNILQREHMNYIDILYYDWIVETQYESKETRLKEYWLCYFTWVKFINRKYWVLEFRVMVIFEG